MSTDAIERTLELHVDPERVWRALTDPDELGRWFGDDSALDLRVGGEAWFGWERQGHFSARLEKVEGPRRLVWRSGRDAATPVDAGASTVVEWTLEPLPDGGTRLRLRESGFARPEDRAENDQGWTEELAELESYLRVGAASSAPREQVH